MARQSTSKTVDVLLYVAEQPVLDHDSYTVTTR